MWEMVANGAAVDMFVTDADDNPVLAKDIKATAILLVGGKSQRVTLQPAEAAASPARLPRPFRRNSRVRCS
jgi:hypothetical protein